ncbi:MAG: hypothetical protein ACRD8U_20715 [Pyrinomonadaceae bacterium]
MTFKRFNWQIWAGFVLSVVAFLSFSLFFVNFPVTRDFPWANLLLFAVALVLIFVGVRRGFANDRPRPWASKISAAILGTLSVLILAFFLFSVFIFARWLPASTGAPQVGQRAPDFSLADSNGRQVTLSELLSSPIDSKAPKGVLLIFYRGYW